MAGIDTAFLRVSEALRMGRDTEVERLQSDLALVGAGQELCDVLRGFGDDFWRSMGALLPFRRPPKGILDDAEHARVRIVPLCADLLLRCGLQSRGAAERVVDDMVKSYAAARAAGRVDRALRVASARESMEDLAHEVCSRVTIFRGQLETGRELLPEQRKLLKRIIKKAALVLSGLVLVLGGVANGLDIYEYVQNSQQVASAVSSIRKGLSSDGKDAVIELGLFHIGAHLSGEDGSPR